MYGGIGREIICSQEEKDPYRAKSFCGIENLQAPFNWSYMSFLLLLGKGKKEEV